MKIGAECEIRNEISTVGSTLSSLYHLPVEKCRSCDKAKACALLIFSERTVLKFLS